MRHTIEFIVAGSRAVKSNKRIRAATTLATALVIPGDGDFAPHARLQYRVAGRGSAGSFQAMLRFTIVFFVLGAALSARPLNLSDDEAYNAVGHLFLYGTNETITLSQAQSRPFRKVEGQSVKRSEFNQTIWFRLRVRNVGPPGNWFLSLNNNRLDHAEFFDSDGAGGYSRQIAGDHHPLREWSQPYSHPVFRFFLESGEERELYFSVRSTSAYNFMVQVYGPMALATRELSQTILHGVNLAITVVYIVLILFLHRRDKNVAILFLIPFSLTYYTYIFMVSGNSYGLWPEYPWIQDRLTGCTVTGSTIFLLLFMKRYLQLRNRMPLMNAAFVAAVALGIPAYYQLYEVTQFTRDWMAWHSVASLALIFFASVLVWRRAYLDVRFFLSFFSLFLTGTLLKFLFYFQALDTFYWYYNWPAVLYPGGLFILLHASIQKYRDALAARKELEVNYNELLARLKPSAARSSRIDSLDKERVLAAISDLIASDDIFERQLFTLEQMAGALGIRPDQLSALINNEMGTTFNEFVNTIRIRRACHLMAAHPDMNVTQILYASGYQSKSPFNIAFRKIMGASPSEYRRRIARPESGSESP